MVLILYGNSEISAHVSGEIGILICLRNLFSFRLAAVTIMKNILDMFATCSWLPYIKSTMPFKVQLNLLLDLLSRTDFAIKYSENCLTGL